jgi:peptide/nickel transport system substrate-binding protein
MTRNQSFRRIATSMALVAIGACGGNPHPDHEATAATESHRRGGRLVAALTSDPATFNPLTVIDAASRTIVEQTTADLVHIDRATHDTVAALAETWAVSKDGRTLTVLLRPDLRFSDGTPCRADEVVFSFECYLDKEVGSPQRDLLLVGNEPIAVRAVDERTVVIEMAAPYAVADRLFDGFAILPRHVLEPAFNAGTLSEAWSTTTPPDEMVGLGPFRLRTYEPGERVVLERNPFYWRTDDQGIQLPYLDELIFLIVPDEDVAALRFEAGELDVLDRISPETFDALSSSSRADSATLLDLGSGLDFTVMFFNRNDPAGTAPQSASWFADEGFRRAVSAAIDRDAIVQLAYRGRATPLTTHVSPGYGLWFNSDLPPPRRSLSEARSILSSNHYRVDPDGNLRDPSERRVEMSLLTTSGSVDRTRSAAIVQQDLAEIGIDVKVIELESHALIQQLFTPSDYEACLLGLGGGDADPNSLMSLLLSSGAHHLWRIRPATPEAAWQSEIDNIMRTQLVTRDPDIRRALYWRAQRLIADHLPFIALASPHVLVGAAQGLQNLKPAVIEPYVLWNTYELYWGPAAGVVRPVSRLRDTIDDDPAPSGTGLPGTLGSDALCGIRHIPTCPRRRHQMHSCRVGWFA